MSKTMSDLRRLCDECDTPEAARAAVLADLAGRVTDYHSGLDVSVFRASGFLAISDGPDGPRTYGVTFGPADQRPVKGCEFGHGDTAEMICGARLSCRVGRLTVVG